MARNGSSSMLRLLSLACACALVANHFAFAAAVNASAALDGGLIRFRKRTMPFGIDEGTTAQYVVSLLTAPANDVTLSLNQVDSQLNPLTTQLMFTALNWNSSQDISLHAVDDTFIQMSPYGGVVEVSSDSVSIGFNSSYADGLQAANLTFLIIETDQANVIITRANVDPSPANIPEGRAGFYDVVLNSRPQQPVVVQFYSENATLLNVFPTVLVFTPGGWNVSQRLTANALDDVIDRASPYSSQFSLQLSSLDTDYNNLTVPNYKLTLEDNDNDQSILHGSLSWTKLPTVSRTTASLRVEMSVNLPSLTRQRSVGDNITLLDTRLSFGDGSTDVFPLTLTVASIHEELGYLVLRRDFMYTYRDANNRAEPWVARVDHCCRRSTLKNNADTRMLLSARLDLADDGSPQPPTLAVFPMSTGASVEQPQALLLHSLAPDSHPVSWQFASAAEYGSVQAGTPQGVSLDATSGRLSWDTSAVASGDYSVLVHSTDFVTGAQSTMEVLLRLVDPSSAGNSDGPSIRDEVITPSSTSLPARTIYASVGVQIQANTTVITANGSMENASLVISGPAPAGVAIVMLPASDFTMDNDTDANSTQAVTSQLTWTPDASQVGRHVICLIATDTSSTRTSPVASSPLCHNILVAMAAVGDVPVIDLNGADIAGNNYQSSFRKGTTADVAIADTMEAVITAQRQLNFMTLRLVGVQDGSNERLVLASGYYNPTLTTSTSTVGLLFSGVGDEMDYGLALRYVRYVNSQRVPALGRREVIIDVFDATGSASSASGTVTTSSITVSIDNMAPNVFIDVNSGSRYNVRFFPGMSPVLVTNPNGTTVSDADSNFLTMATVQITNIQDNMDEVLNATYTSPERLTLPVAYQTGTLSLSFGRQWLAEDRSRAARRPSGPEVPTVNASIWVDENFTVGQVDVVVDVAHSWVGDLELVLEHGDRKQTLVSRPGGQTCAEDDLIHTVFSQSASRDATISASTTAPGLCTYQTRGVFSADGDLGVFNGTSASGQWTLYVSDRSLLEDNGMLTGFGLLLQPQEAHLIAVNEPLQPAARLSSGSRQLTHQLVVSGSGGRVVDLHVRLFMQARFTDRSNRLLPSVSLRHPDGTQITLLNCSSSSCVNGSDEYNFLLFSDRALSLASDRLQGSCCAASMFSMVMSAPAFSSNNVTDPLVNASDCFNSSETPNNLIDIFQPVESLSTFEGKPLDGTWTLVVSLPDSACSSDQEVTLHGWGIQASREPNIDAMYNFTSGVLELTGLDTPENYESVLRGVTYENRNPMAEFTVVREITIAARDNLAQSVAATASLTVHHIDIDLNPDRMPGEPPAPHIDATFVEETSPIGVSENSSATLRDLSPGFAPLYVMTITLNQPMNGDFEGLSIATNLPPGLSADFSMSNSSLTVSSSMNTSYDISVFERLLRSVVYYNTAEELAGDARNVTTSVQDTARSGQFYSLVARTTITLVHTNDAPVLDVNGDFEPLGSISNMVEYQEGQGGLPLSNITGVILYDYDNLTLSSVRVTISPLPDTSQYEILAADLAMFPNISMQQNATGRAELLLFGVDTVENYREAIATVTYANRRSGDLVGRPTTTPRRISFVVHDGLRDSEPAVVVVTFAAVNDRPLLDLNGAGAGIDFSTAHTEEQGSVIINSDMTIFDVDNITLKDVTVTITNLQDIGSEFLSVSSIVSTSMNISGKVLQTTVIRAMSDYNESTGVLVVSGLDTVQEYEQVMRTLRYDNIADEPTPVSRQITVVANDGLLTSPLATVTVDMVLVNDSPYLNGAFRAEANTTEDVTDAENTGSLVSMFDALIDDDDAASTKGIAVVAVDNANGQWEMTVDGVNWLALDDSNVSESSAVVLRSDADNALRFVPNRDFNGEVSALFLAWDATAPSLVDGSTIDASLTSSINAFSNNSLNFTVNVIAVNDAPVLTPVAVSMTAIMEDDYSSAGDAVETLLNTTLDVDLSSMGVDRELGVAVIGVDIVNGTWQYSQDGGLSWNAMLNVSNTSAILLPQRPAGMNRVRFVPNRDMNGRAYIRYLAWDLTLSVMQNDSANATSPLSPDQAVIPIEAVTMIDTTASDPVTGEFSTDSNTATVTILPVNDSPLLGNAFRFQNFSEDLDEVINHGTLVSDIVSQTYADVDVDFVVGVAVTRVDNANGVFQYTCNRTAILQWSNFIGDLVYGQFVPPLPLRSRSTLLAGYCRIRFLPNENFNTVYDVMHMPRPVADRPTVGLLAWDRTGATAGFDTRYGVDATATGPCVTGPFSCVERTMSVHIRTVNDIPVLMLNSTADNYEATYVEDTLGAAVVTAEMSLIDVDHALLQSVTLIVHNATELPNLANITVDYSNTTLNDTDSSDPICNGSATRREELLIDLSSTSLIASVRSYCPYVMILSAASGDGAPVAQYQHALRTLRYNNSIEEPSDQDRLVIFSVDDGIDRSETRYTLLHVQPVDDVPSLDLNGDDLDLNFFVNYTEGDGAVPIVSTTDLRILDHDNLFLQWARIDLVTAPDRASEHLNVTIPPSITGIRAEFAVENNTLMLTGQASLADYELVLRTVTYINTEYSTGFPSDDDRQVDFTISDGSSESVVVSSFIMFTRINDRPYLDLNGDTSGQDYVQNYYEQRGPVAICDPSLEIIDIDNVTLDSITIRIVNIQDGMNEVLAVSSLVDSEVLQRDDYSQQRIVQRTHLTPNVTYDAIQGMMVIRGLQSLDDFRRILVTLTYDNLRDEPTAVARQISIVLNDGLVDSLTRTTTMNIVLINDSPVLSATLPLINPLVDEDALEATTNGFNVETMADLLISDVDDLINPVEVKGIAIVFVNNTNGRWQYRTNTRRTYADIATSTSYDLALHLFSNTASELRFLPNSDYNGPTTLEFVAWDRSNGYGDGDVTNATAVNVTDAYSHNSRTLVMTVVPVNDAPLINSAAIVLLSNINEDDRNSSGDAVSVLLQAWSDDVDGVAEENRGVAIVSGTTLSGHWEFSTNAGVSWTVIGAVSASSALVLWNTPAASNRVRFVPAQDFNGQVTLNFRVWDRNSTEASGTLGVDTNTDVVTGPFSSGTATARLTVDPVNDSPRFTSDMELLTILEDPTVNTGDFVSVLVRLTWFDTDHVVPSFINRGFAVTGVYNGPSRSYGEWQYTCALGSTLSWESFKGDVTYGVVHPRDPLVDKATLLGPTCRVRFNPVGDYNTQFDNNGAARPQTDRPCLSVKAWDLTAGTANTYGVDTVSLPYDHTDAFSQNISQACVSITSQSDAPVVHLGDNTTDYTTTFTEAIPPARTVYPVRVTSPLMTISDADNASLSSITIQMAALDTSASERLFVNTAGTSINATHTSSSASQIVLQLRPIAGPNAPVGDFQTVLRTLMYENSIEEPDPTGRVVTVTTRDATTFTRARSTILIQLLNDPPELDLDTTMAGLDNVISYTEGDGAVLLLNTSHTLLDFDNLMLQTATVTIRQAFDDIREVLATDTSGTAISAAYNGSTLTLTGPDTVANFRRVLGNVTYLHNDSMPGNPDMSMRFVDFVVNDGQNDSLLASSMVTFTAVNDRPYLDLNGRLSGVNHSVLFNEQKGAVLLTTNDSFIIEVDNITLARATVRITNLMDGIYESLRVSNVRDYSDEITARMLTVTNIYPAQVYDNTTGTLVITGLATVAEYERVLRTARYNNSRDEPDLQTRVIEFILSDGHLDSTPVYTTVSLAGVNDSPYFRPGVSVIQPNIAEDVPNDSNPGVSLEELLQLIAGDDDSSSQLGLAVIGVDNSQGTWQFTTDYSDNNMTLDSNSTVNDALTNSTMFNDTLSVNETMMDNGNTTSFFATWQSISSSVSQTTAVALRADSGRIRIRFVPALDFNGDTSMMFVAWDATDNLADGSLTNARDRGLLDPYSNTTRTLTITVDPVNDAPLLARRDVQLSTILEDDRGSYGNTILSLVVNGTDVDTTTQEFGIAVVSMDTENGAWEFTSDGGSTWRELANISMSSATVIRSRPDTQHRIRFSPSQDYHGQAQFTFVLWDQTDGIASGSEYVDVATADRVIGAFSVLTANATITVEPINDSPAIREGPELSTINEDDRANSGTRVIDIVSDVYVDVDFDSMTGIAVTGVDNRFGSWQYMCPGNSAAANWTTFIGDLQYGVIVPVNPRPEKATLLAGNCRVRFLPVLNFNTLRDLNGDLRPETDIPFIYIRGWDGTGVSAGRSGRYGQDTTYNNRSHLNEFSADTRMATVSVTSIDDHPVLSLQTESPLLFQADYVEDSPFVRIVDPIALNLTDEDHSRMEQVTVTIVRIYDPSNETLTLRPLNTSLVMFDAARQLATVRINSTRTESLSVVFRQVAVRQPLARNTSNSSDPMGSGMSGEDSDSGESGSGVLSNGTATDNSTTSGNMTMDGDDDNLGMLLYYEGVLTVRSSTGERVSKEAYIAVLQSLVYINRNTEPDNSTRRIAFAVDDSEVVVRNAATALSTTLRVDNNPLLNLTITDLNYTENQAVAIIDLAPSLTLYDYDHNEFFGMVSASAVLTPAPTSANETLGVDEAVLNDTNIQVRFDTATGHLLLSGLETVTKYESVLQTLMYSNTETEPGPHNRTVTVQVVDTNNLLSNEIEISIEMTLINDRVPVITAPGPFSAREHPLSATPIGNGLVLSDADSGDFFQSRVVLTITNGVDGESERIRLTDVPASINVTENLYTLLLDGPASVADFNQALASLTYINNAEEPGPSTRMISVEAFDESFNSSVMYIQVAIVLTNDLPIVDINGPAEPGFSLMVNYEEGVGPINIVTRQMFVSGLSGSGSGSDSGDGKGSGFFPVGDSVLTLSDNDHQHLSSAIVRLVEVPDAPNEILSANTSQTRITVMYDAASGVLNLTGNDSLTNYQRVLRSVTYEHRESDPGVPDTRARNVTFLIFDGRHYSVPVWSIVTFAAVNDAPILDLNPADATTTFYNTAFTEELGPVYAVHPLATIEDIDTAQLSSLAVVIENVLDEGFEFLSFNMTPAVRLVFSSAIINYSTTAGLLAVQLPATVAEYQALLRTLQYDNTRDEPNFAERSLRITANDGELDSLPVYSLIDMVAVNDPPRLNVSEDVSGVYQATFTEGDAPVEIVSNSSLVIEDDDDKFLTELFVNVTGVRDPRFEAVFIDELSLTTQLTGFVGVRNGCPMPGLGTTTLLLNRNFSIRAWLDVMRALRYCNADEHPVSGIRNITLALRDPSGAQTMLRTTQVRVIHVNDQPFLNITNVIPERVELIEDTNASIPVLFAFADYEETLDGNAIRIIQQPSPSEVIVNVSAGAIDFFPRLDDIGNRTAIFEICDSVGHCSEPFNITFDLRPQNDAPRPVEPLTLTMIEDEAVIVDVARYFSDAEDDLLPDVKPIVDLRSFNIGPSISIELTDHNLTVTPFPNANGMDSIQFDVCDNSIPSRCTHIEVVVTIVAVNDLPIAEASATPLQSISTNEDTPVRIPIQVGDLEDRAFLPVTVIEVGHGTAAPDTADLTSTIRFADDIYVQSMHIRFVPERDYYGNEAYVVFMVEDSDGGNNTARINITVFYDNDAPTFGIQTLTTDEDTVINISLPEDMNITDTEDVLHTTNISLITPASIGNVSYTASTGSLVYVPPLNFFSTPSRNVTFNLQVCDTNARNPSDSLCTTNTITVVVISVNDVPLAPTLELIVDEEASGSVDLYAALFDVEDGKPPMGNVLLDLSQTSKGVAVYDATTGLVMYTTNPGAFGGDTILYTVCDSESACNSSGVITVTVAPINDPPVATNFTHQTSEDDFDLVAIYEHISDNDTQSNRDNLLAELRIQVVGDNGIYYSVYPTGQQGVLRVYQTHGIVTYQAPNNYVGHDSFRYSVCDRCDPRRNNELGRTGDSVAIPACSRQLLANNGQLTTSPSNPVYITCSEASVALVVGNVNDVPILKNISAETTADTAVVLSPLTMSFANNMFANSQASVYDRDDAQSINATRDGLNLALFNLSTNTDINTTHLVARTLPVNGSVETIVDPTTGFAQLRYTPRANTYGYDSFEYEVCDRANGTRKVAACAQAIATIYVATDGPRIISITAEGNLPATEGGAVELDSKFSRNDRIVVRFAEPTNMAPVFEINNVFGTADVDRMLVFSNPFVDPITVADRYQALWSDPQTLRIQIVDEGYPQPNITYGVWQVGVQSSVSPCNGFNPDTQLPYSRSEMSQYCLLSADGLSRHSQQDTSAIPTLGGSFGDVLPNVADVIYRNTGVDPVFQQESESLSYFGPGSEILVYLQPPLSAPQLEELCWRTALEIFNYDRIDTLGQETVLGLSSCANLLNDGSNIMNVVRPTPGTELPRLPGSVRRKRDVEDDTGVATVDDDQEAVLHRGKRQTTSALTVMPVVSQIIIVVRSYSGVHPALNGQDFAERVRRSLNANLLKLIIFRNASATAEPDPAPSPILYQQHRSEETPLALSFVASDPDNGDSEYGVGDIFTITFDRDTNQPPVGLKTHLDKIFNFSTPLGLDYVGSWSTPSTLVITVTRTDSTLNGVAIPQIGNLKFTFTTSGQTGSRFVPSTQPNCIGSNVCGGNESSSTIGICAASATSCRATGTGPILDGDFGSGAGLPTTQSLWWISLIVILFVFIVVVVAYAVHRHHKNEAFRREAMQWVKKWQNDPKGKDVAVPGKPPAPHEEWARPTPVVMMKGKDPFEVLPPSGEQPSRPPSVAQDPFSGLPSVSDESGRPILPRRTSTLSTFDPRRPPSIADVFIDNVPNNRPGLPPLKRPEMPTTPLQGAPLDLPPLKPAPRQPAFAGLNNAPGQRKLPPLGGPTSYDPSSLPSGDTRPSLPPLRGAIQPLPLGNLPQAGPSPPPASFSQQSGRQPSRKRIMHEVIDSQSSGMFEATTDTQTAESANATEAETNSGSDPALLSDPSFPEVSEGMPPPRSKPAPRPLISPISRRTSLVSPEGGSRGNLPGPGANAQPRIMRRPSQSDPFGAGLTRQLSHISRQGSIDNGVPFQQPNSPPPMTRMSRQNTGISLLGATGRTLPRNTTQPISPTGRNFNRQSTGQFALPPRTMSTTSGIGTNFPQSQRPPGNDRRRDPDSDQ